ncbi:Gfo/Idh/MocA family oxidoreductase [Actinoplanes sp. NPDC051851]|uniref:Gfo/Idh/MocA family protein n=1 Tax=Actinoplanes sp. NPDC051851 TaxID=3154753 RepID=UPI0034405A06
MKRVALIGAGGHGLSHRRNLRRLADLGRLEIAGYCDRNPVDHEPGIPFFEDHTQLLSTVRPELVIICTPPHTHLPIALDCLAAGADLLLEKPPVTSLAEHDVLAAAVRDAGRACQVGFQALASPALPYLVGRSGPVSAAGAWWRPDTYYKRAPWAGRQASFDGALVNPFAHALMQALVVADLDPVTVELERYRSRDIQTDDNTFLRATGTDGRTVTVAVSLASAVFIAGEITVEGAVSEYPTDRLRLPGESDFSEMPGRVDLLENLISGEPLIVPLALTRPFTAVAEAIVASAPPYPIPAEFLTPHPSGEGNAVPGIDELVRQVASTGRLPSELGVPWARTPLHLSL